MSWLQSFLVPLFSQSLDDKNQGRQVEHEGVLTQRCRSASTPGWSNDE